MTDTQRAAIAEAILLGTEFTERRGERFGLTVRLVGTDKEWLKAVVRTRSPVHQLVYYRCKGESNLDWHIVVGGVTYYANRHIP